MNRFLNLASKGLAVIGVLTLMWTAGEMHQTKAQAAPVPGVCSVEPVPNKPAGWFYCHQGSCPSPTDTCCDKPYVNTDSTGLTCCKFICTSWI